MSRPSYSHSLKNYGIDVELNKDTVSVELKDGLKVLRFKDRSTGEEGSVAAEEILYRSGR